MRGRGRKVYPVPLKTAPERRTTHFMNSIFFSIGNNRKEQEQ